MCIRVLGEGAEVLSGTFTRSLQCFLDEHFVSDQLNYNIGHLATAES